MVTLKTQSPTGFRANEVRSLERSDIYKGEGKGGPNPRKGGVRDKLSLLLFLMSPGMDIPYDKQIPQTTQSLLSTDESVNLVKSLLLLSYSTVLIL